MEIGTVIIPETIYCEIGVIDWEGLSVKEL